MASYSEDAYFIYAYNAIPDDTNYSTFVLKRKPSPELINNGWTEYVFDNQNTNDDILAFYNANKSSASNTFIDTDIPNLVILNQSGSYVFELNPSSGDLTVSDSRLEKDVSVVLDNNNFITAHP